MLEGRFDLEDGDHAPGVLDAAGIVALGRLAVHLGDARQVRKLSDTAHVMSERGTPAVRSHAGWLLALYALSDGDSVAARRSGPAQRWNRMGGRSCLGSPWTSPTKCSWPVSRSRPATTNSPIWHWRSHATVLR